MVNQHLVINNMVPCSIIPVAVIKTHLCMAWLETSCIVAIRIYRLDELLYLLLLVTLESVDPLSMLNPNTAFYFFYQAVFPYWLLLSTINVSLSRLNFYFNAASVHGRSCRPSVESADCIEIPPASERVFLEIPSSCLIAKTTQPVTSYIYIL